MHGDDIFVAGPRQETAKMGATLKKRWETRDQMIGPKPDDQKDFRILNRTLRWCKDGLVFAANLRHGLSKSKPVSSPATGEGAERLHSDELKPLDEEEQRQYQRIVAKINYPAHDRQDLKYATSCLASAVSSLSLGDMQGAKRVGRGRPEGLHSVEKAKPRLEWANQQNHRERGIQSSRENRRRFGVAEEDLAGQGLGETKKGESR